MAGIFKAYDIRGIVTGDDAPLTPQRAYLIGRGLAQNVFAGFSPIAITHDMRTHSPAMYGELSRGLRDGGCDVIEVGPVRDADELLGHQPIRRAWRRAGHGFAQRAGIQRLQKSAAPARRRSIIFRVSIWSNNTSWTPKRAKRPRPPKTSAASRKSTTCCAITWTG